MKNAEPSAVRCADWSRAQRRDPVGTAGSYAGYLLVEWPLPWPRDAGDIDGLEPVRRAASGLDLRLQLLVPSGGDRRRVALYRRPEGPFTAFSGLDVELSLQGLTPERVREELRAGVEQLLSGGGTPVDGHEVLVCTHGSRDRCCGSLGTELWLHLDAEPRREHVRIRRTSHTGGHRFAATGVVLPEGTVWGYLDEASIERIVARTGDLDDLLPRYRGCSGLGTPAAQAVERAVLAELGWELFDCARHVDDLADGRVRLTLTTPTSTAAWEARVVSGRTVPVPDCGQPPELATRSETEQLVVDLVRVE